MDLMQRKQLGAIKLNWLLIICCLILMVSGIGGFVISLKVYSQYSDSAADPSIPVGGDVAMIQTFHYPATFVKQLQGDRDAGRKIFTEFCQSCHAPQPLIDVPAPRMGDKVAWKARRAQGMPTLLKITITGVGAMPARGGCFECSDAQLQETIKYILRNS
jgi:cytochrome c5